jgi:hypothetical protein
MDPLPTPHPNVEILVTPLARERLIKCGMHIALPLQAIVNILYFIAFVPVNAGIRKPFRLAVHEGGASGASVFILPPVRKNVIRAADVVPGQVPKVASSVPIASSDNRPVNSEVSR